MHWIIYNDRLKVFAKASLDIGSDVNIAMKQKNLGMCFMVMNQPADALDFIHRSLKIYEKASNNIASVMRVYDFKHHS